MYRCMTNASHPPYTYSGTALTEPLTFLFQANNENAVPQPMQEKEKARSWPKTCLLFTFRSMLSIPPNYHGPLLFFCCSYLVYQGNKSTKPIDFQFGTATTKVSQSQLISLGEAFTVFFPVMVDIVKFILFYGLSFILILPLHPGVQIFFILLLISAPLHYFPDLGRKASGINVACGSFKLPLIRVTIVGAVVLSLICALLTSLVVYYNWIHMHKGKAEVKEIEVSLDDLSEILLDV